VTGYEPVSFGRWQGSSTSGSKDAPQGTANAASGALVLITPNLLADYRLSSCFVGQRRAVRLFYLTTHSDSKMRLRTYDAIKVTHPAKKNLSNDAEVGCLVGPP